MYALNLSQKAKELKKEKRKSDTLLYQMLPLSVATQLKQTQKVIVTIIETNTSWYLFLRLHSCGIRFLWLLVVIAFEMFSFTQVPAEYYEAVTIYFSDIVGFTEIAAECSPLEVIIINCLTYTYIHTFYNT